MWVDRALTGTVDDLVEQRLLCDILDCRCSALKHAAGRQVRNAPDGCKSSAYRASDVTEDTFIHRDSHGRLLRRAFALHQRHTGDGVLRVQLLRG